MADKPVTREEKYLAYLTGDYTGELPKPITRKEKYLYELCLKGIGGEISPEEIKAAVNEYLEKNPVKPGATTEQAQQIEQNKTDVASLKEETGSLKEDLDEMSDSLLKVVKTVKSSNLFDASADYDDGFLSSDYTIIKEGYSALATTGYIKINGCKHITLTRMKSGKERMFEPIAAVGMYDINKQPINYFRNSKNLDYIDIIDKAYYVRVTINKEFCFTKSSIYKPMLSCSTEVTEYEPYFGQYKEVFKNYPHCTDNIVCWGRFAHLWNWL